MNKRLIMAAMSLVLLGFLAQSAFAGGSSEQQGAAASGQPVKLTIWGRDLADGTPDHAYVTALIKDFPAKFPNVTLDYVPLGDPGLANKTKIAMASGSGIPDIFQTWGGQTMGGYADAGRLIDLTAELKNVPGSAAAQGAMSWKGKIYGVAPFFAIAGIFVNEGIFQRLNLTPPKTIAEMEQVADKLKANGIQPFALGAKDKWPALATYMYLTNRYGGDIFHQAQARTARFDSAPFVQAAQKYQEWIRKGYYGDKPLGEAYGDAQQLMATGKAGMMVTGSWMCGQFSSKDFTDQTIGFYPFPILAGGKGLATDVMGQTDIGFAATTAAAGKKAAVVEFMKYAMSPQAAAAEPGRISSVPGVKAPSHLTEMAAAVFAQAKAVTFWWDQDLPPAVTTPMNDTIQTFFLPGTDVKSSLTKFEATMSDNVGPVK